MISDSGKTVSPWFPTVEMPSTAALNQDIAVDVCVVGAGISGLSTAYSLAREGRKVAVLDDGPIGGGETGRTTAFIISPTRTSLSGYRAKNFVREMAATSFA